MVNGKVFLVNCSALEIPIYKVLLGDSGIPYLCTESDNAINGIISYNLYVNGTDIIEAKKIINEYFGSKNNPEAKKVEKEIKDEVKNDYSLAGSINDNFSEPYLNQPKKYLKHFAYLLIIAGIIESIILYFRIKNNTSFSSGSIFYIVAGITLIKGSKKIYLRARNAALAFFAVSAGAFLASLYLRLQVLVLPSGLISKMVFSSIPISLVLYISLFSLLSFVFWKRETLIHYGEDIENQMNIGNHTLCIPKGRFNLTIIGSVFVGLLFLGPNIIINPYKYISEEVKDYSNSIETLEVKSTAIHNWISSTEFVINEDPLRRLVATFNPLTQELSFSEMDAEEEKGLFNNY